MKRAMVQDIAFWAIIVFIFGIMLFTGAKLNTDFTEHYQNSSAGTTAKSIQQQASDRYESIWDNAFMFVFFLFGLAIIVVLYYLKSTPTLFFVGVILLAIVALPIAILGNAFEDFADETEMAGPEADMPVTGWLMSHILEIGIAFGFLGLILLFSRSGGGY